MPSVDATASGLPYAVLTVGGETPGALDQFVGPISFTVDKSGAHSSVAGIGTQTGDQVRFHEKNLSDGKDVRVWQIRQTGPGAFTAETVPTFQP